MRSSGAVSQEFLQRAKNLKTKQLHLKKPALVRYLKLLTMTVQRAKKSKK
uniref:Uncharacterized protein n=1 Tax=Arundo donax TaxID=35708 RepID=A0A0A9F4X0_ARUDO